MHIWTINKWTKYYNPNDKDHRSGLRLRFDADVNEEVKRACKEFCIWLRKNYYFPIRVPVYIKSSAQIKSLDSEYCSATFFGPYDKHIEPYIRVSTGEYEKSLKKNGKDDTLAAILCSISHELTHYFQWINDINLTDIGIERQASSYAKFLVYEKYADIREHP